MELFEYWEKEKDYSKLRELIQTCEDVNYVHEKYHTFMYFLLDYKHILDVPITCPYFNEHERKEVIETLKLLLSKGADINKNTGFYDPLRTISSSNEYEITKFLIENGAIVFSEEKAKEFDLLSCTISYLTFLNNMEIDITPEHIQNLKNIISLFLEHGYDINYRVKDDFNHSICITLFYDLQVIYEGCKDVHNYIDRYLDVLYFLQEKGFDFQFYFDNNDPYLRDIFNSLPKSVRENSRFLTILTKFKIPLVLV